MHHMYAKRRPEKMWWVALICMGIAASVMASKAVVAQTTVVVSQGIDPRMLDPAHDTLVSSRSIMSNIYDTLLWRDSTGLATPSLAKSWEFLDNTTLRLHLRDDVKFHDGSAFSAADVIFTTARYTDKENEVPIRAYVKGLWDSIEAPDDYTIDIKMPTPSATILGDLTRLPMLPAKAFDELGEEYFVGNAIGTGPFRFSSWQRNQEIVLEAFDDHFRGRPQIDRLVFKPIPEDFARYAGLTTGEIDIVSNLPPERAGEVDDNPDLKVAKIPSTRGIHIGINMKIEPFNDVRVRQALNHAVDVPELIDTVLEGQASLNPNFCQIQLFGHDPKIEPRGYDLDKAKALLAEAGYPNGFETQLLGPTGRYMKDREVMEAIAGQLGRAGIKVSIVAPEWGEFLDQWYGRRAHAKPFQGMYLVGIGGQTMDCNRTFMKRGTVASRLKYWESDNTEKLSELYAEQKAILDPSMRFEKWKEIEALVQEDVPWIFLYDQVDIYGMSTRIKWEPRPDEFIWGFDISVNE